MGGQQHAECVQVLCHPSKQQSTNEAVWGGGDKIEGQFGGIEPQKRVKVELIEWRSVDIHSISSKSTFCPPQGGKHMVLNLGLSLKLLKRILINYGLSTCLMGRSPMVLALNRW
jgi:hypothetical protein